MYSIIKEAEKGKNLGIGYLVLVDRSKTKERWWTSNGDLPILKYRKLSATNYACNRLKYGNCYVVSSEEAEEILKQQRKIIIHEEALASCYEGWQGHKLEI